jgi:hypothetical protein
MLSAVVHVGEPAPLGGGFEPAAVAHLRENGVPRFLAYELDERGGLQRVPGAYAPDPDEEPPHPITDLLLALYPEGSSVAQRLSALSTKAEANYGASLRRKVFDSDVARGSPGYGRHFEARSQLEAHPYEAVVAVGLLPGVGDAMREALEANFERLDAPVRRFSQVPE